jgi:hypothetical protein
MEQGEAAPTAGAAPASPDNPGKKNDASVGDMELDISKDDRDTVDQQGEFITSLKPLYFKSHGIKAAPPIFLQVLQKYDDGSARVKIMYSLCNKRKLRTSEGEPLQIAPQDQEAFLSRQELDDIRLGAFDQSAAGGGMGGAMGGMPPPPGGLV